ncbi:hypothetical protein DQE80_17110, partial [Enterococcus sp. HPCN18]
TPSCRSALRGDAAVEAAGADRLHDRQRSWPHDHRHLFGHRTAHDDDGDAGDARRHARPRQVEGPRHVEGPRQGGCALRLR